MNKLIKQKLILSQIVRVLLTICIVYIDIPLFVKIILIMVVDSIDCGISKNLFKDWINCSSQTYQRSDKITDTLCYTLLLVSICFKKNLTKQQIYLVVGLFIYRLLGTILFLIKNSREYLFYFPNYFLEITLVLSFTKYIPFIRKNIGVFIVTTMLLKIIQEYYLHIYKPRLNKNYLHIL